MKSDFYAAISQIAAERGIPRESVQAVIEDALKTAYKRYLGNNPPPVEVTVKLDPVSGDARVYAEKQVVDDVLDDRLEIDIADAQRIRSDVTLGETVLVESTPRDFGRIAAQTAKQVVLQRIKEVERDQVYGEYFDREGEIITARVQRHAKGNVILELGRAEAIMPPKEQSPSDRYYPNTPLKVYLAEIKREDRGPRLIVSRSRPELITRLFEMEVPEIYNGAVEIKGIAREAGVRSKVAVHARQEGVDPVGSCVGMRGTRIQNIVNELNNEKIDVVQWSANPRVFIANALSPATAVEVQLHDDQTCTVIVPDKQQSLAIGKEGQNVRLAAKLTGWRIDIKSASDLLDEERGIGEARSVVDAEAMAQASALQLAEVEHRQVNEFGLIDYNNMPFGPLPSELIGQQVELRAAQGKLNVYHGGRMVASYILDDDLI
ncbi:MAG: transcription termination/antitermination protein NusA [Herpetosiphonaceae bacterium]|nr:transcription termination/antitermination protein NusA [Herpetosiphonaceae bacterium]